MADKSIDQLTEATSMYSSDLFAISQGGQAKKVSWLTFLTDLTTALDGHGGISSIAYTAPSSGSLVGTLTITYADPNADPVSFSVTNGRGITGISKTGTSGLTDTYTISYNNSTTSTYTVKNGKGIASVTKTAAVPPSLTDTYTITYNDNSTPFEFTVDNGNGIADIADKWAVSSSNSTAPSTWYNSPQTMTAVNKYEWHYEIITLDDGSTIDTDKAVVGVYGDTGDNWYVHIKWAATEPTQDSDLEDEPDAWMGIYAGVSQTAPTAYNAYYWYMTKGLTGDDGLSIVNVTLYSSSGLTDTYHVNYENGSFDEFTVTNGSQIRDISYNSTVGLTDTYTVNMTDGSSSTFDVTNGRGIVSITGPGTPGLPGETDTYTITYNDGDTSVFYVYNGTNGTGSVSTVDDIAPTNGNVTLLLLGSGAPTVNTPGQVKQRYFDTVNNVLYVCVAVNEQSTPHTYTWRGSSVTVDSVLSTSSTNPVQNAVLTTLLGTSVLTTTSQNLTGAVNELNGGKVAKAGDTMVGDLDIKSPNLEDGTPPVGSHVTGQGVYFQDKNAVDITRVAPYFTTDGRQGLNMASVRTISNTDYSNFISLFIDSSGDYSVALRAEAWRKALGLGDSSGDLPVTVSQGGTGMSAVETESDKTHVITAASGFQISNATFKQWGKIAQIYVVAKKTTAQTSPASMKIGNLVSGKRPALLSSSMCTDQAISYGYITASNGSDPGSVSVYGTWPTANSEKTIIATFILP